MALTVSNFDLARMAKHNEAQMALKPGSIPIKVEPVKIPDPIPLPVKEPVKV